MRIVRSNLIVTQFFWHYIIIRKFAILKANFVILDINLPWELLETIVNFLINKDFSYLTASLHEEVMKLFLTLLSTQMFQNNQGQHENLFLNLLFNVPQGQFLRTADLVRTRKHFFELPTH
jgi:hypothetical protein